MFDIDTLVEKSAEEFQQRYPEFLELLSKNIEYRSQEGSYHIELTNDGSGSQNRPTDAKNKVLMYTFSPLSPFAPHHLDLDTYLHRLGYQTTWERYNGRWYYTISWGHENSVEFGSD